MSRLDFGMFQELTTTWPINSRRKPPDFKTRVSLLGFERREAKMTLGNVERPIGSQCCELRVSLGIRPFRSLDEA